MSLDEDIFTDDLEQSLTGLRSSMINLLMSLRASEGDKRLEIKLVKQLRSDLDRAVNHLRSSKATTEEKYKEFLQLELTCSRELAKLRD